MNSTSDRTSGSWPPRVPRETLLFGAAYAAYYGIYCLFLSFMVTYLTQAGYSPLFCGAAGTASYLISVLAQPVIGYITDSRMPMRPCLQLVTAAALAGTVLIPHALPSAPATLIVLTGVAAVVIPLMSLLDVWAVAAQEVCPKLNYSVVRAGGSLGYGILSLIMGVVVQRRGTGVIFPVQMIFCLLLLSLLHWLPDVAMHNRDTGKRSLSLRHSLQVTFKDRGFRFAVVLMFLYWLTHRMMGSYLALLVQAVGGDTAAFGVVAGLGGFAEVLIPLFGVQWIRRCPMHRLLLICLCLNIVRPVFCLLSLFWGTGLFAWGQILQSIGFSIYFTASVECLARLVPVQIKNTAISLGMALSSLLGTVCANLAGGLLIEYFGALSTVSMTLVLAVFNVGWLVRGCARFPELTPSIIGWSARHTQDIE